MERQTLRYQERSYTIRQRCIDCKREILALENFVLDTYSNAAFHYACFGEMYHQQDIPVSYIERIVFINM